MEVLSVVAREALSNPSVQVHHSRDAVVAKPINVVLVNVPAQVGQQEAKHLPLGEVEHSRVPLLMDTLTEGAEEGTGTDGGEGGEGMRGREGEGDGRENGTEGRGRGGEGMWERERERGEEDRGKEKGEKREETGT